MESYIGLDTISELSIAIVGFAAIVSVFRGSDMEQWHPRARLAFWLIIGYGLGTVFFALLPSMLSDLGMPLWRPPMIALAVSQFVGLTLFLRKHFQFLRSGMRSPNNSAIVFVILLTTLSTSVLLGGTAGLINSPLVSLYHFGVTANLLIAAVSFAAVLRLGNLPTS